MNQKQRDMLDQAKQDVATAKHDLERNALRAAASRAYFAMFNVASSLLLEKGLSFSKHTAVVAAYGEHFAGKEGIPLKSHRYLHDALDKHNRGIDDFDFDVNVNPHVILKQIEHAELFLEIGNRILGDVTKKNESPKMTLADQMQERRPSEESNLADQIQEQWLAELFGDSTVSCVKCSNRIESNDGKQLRDGSTICLACVENIETRIAELSKELNALERGENEWSIWGYLRVIIILGVPVLSLYLVLRNIARPNVSDTLMLGVVLIVLILGTILVVFVGALVSFLEDWVGKRKKKPIKRTIQDVKAELIVVMEERSSFYALFWELPPDYRTRRRQVIERDKSMCQECGKRMTARNRQRFHVHHIIPKVQPKGVHSIDNLLLLCELCHSKQEAPGHDKIAKEIKQRRADRRRRMES